MKKRNVSMYHQKQREFSNGNDQIPKRKRKKEWRTSHGPTRSRRPRAEKTSSSRRDESEARKIFESNREIHALVLFYPNYLYTFNRFFFFFFSSLEDFFNLRI